MTLRDYTYIATLGQTCAANFQLARAALAAGVPGARCTGPFDWISLDVSQAIEVIGANFDGYFGFETVSLSEVQDPEDHWQLVDGRGIQSRHQLRREGSESVPTASAWFEFGKWLGAHLRAWHDNLGDESGNLLFIRLEDPFTPDSVSDILRLADLLADKAAGRIRLAWVRFDQTRLTLRHPKVLAFRVRPVWPRELESAQIDWLHDYGLGVAWRGNDADWDAIWGAL
jgi:hypothetical protein